MKRYLICIECVLIFIFCGLITLAKEAPLATVPISASENASAGSVSTPLESETAISELEPSADFAETKQDDHLNNFKQAFVEAASQNSGVASDVTAGGGQPVVLTLTDVATAELEQRAILPSQNANDDTQTNETAEIPEAMKDINRSRSQNTQQTDQIDILSTKDNLTEEIPSFSEWAQKQLEEAEKNKESSSHNLNGKQTKLRWKNYASLDCGAKVVASNPEAVSASAVLSPSKDEYKLNTCTSRIWFIVELCEAIQAKKIDFANFELFSSSPKDFVVSVSDRFPTREWSNVGHFTAKDERDIQSFDLHPHLFGKYIKVEVKSHYGSEHYCPISLFRVYGTSEFEALQKEEDPVHSDRDDDDEDDDDEETLEQNGDSSKNLFSSATDAVLSMVKKAAEVLGNKGNHSNQTEILNETKEAVPSIKVCMLPSHLIVCDNCTETLYEHIYELLSCEDEKVKNLASVPLMRRVLTETAICQKFGLDFGEVSRPEMGGQRGYIEALLPERLVGAMCNMIGVFQNKLGLNVSSQYLNDTVTDDDKLMSIETSELHVVPIETSLKEPDVTDALNVAVTDTVTRSTCSTDVSYASQIKPTRTMISDLDIRDSVTESSSVVTTEPVRSNVTEEVASQETEEVENVSESVEVLEEQLEHLIDFNGAVHTATSISTPQGQKESVFLRLSNRIKALERNMSLSGQYLEELSKRYKKQVEEIQKLLDRTIVSINEESKKQDERNKQLEERLAVLTNTVETLIAEKRSWSSTIYCVIVSSLVTLFIVTFCCKIPEPNTHKGSEVKRLKSAELASPQPPQKKRRRPSDQALKIVRSSTDADCFKKKKKKKQTLKRSNSIGTVNEEKRPPTWARHISVPAEAPVDWVEGKHLEEVPFVLEESEHSSLEPLALAEGGNVIVPAAFIKTALSSRSARINGDAVLPVNGSVNFGNGGGTPKKERKGLGKIFKKVFRD